jgi:hypothetical protein
MGERTIAAQGSASSQRSSALLCVTASGERLPPFVIFSGSKNGPIRKKELVNLHGYPKDMVYTTQKSAWMDEATMVEWVECVWKPFVMKRKGLCLLILDEAKSHMTSTVCRQISDLGTILEIIPGGYTSKLQVLDVGINRPFKYYYEEMSYDFVREWTAKNVPGEKPKPSRQDVAKWIQSAWSMISSDTIVRTWRRCEYVLEDKVQSNDTPTVNSDSSSTIS